MNLFMVLGSCQGLGYCLLRSSAPSPCDCVGFPDGSPVSTSKDEANRSDKLRRVWMSGLDCIWTPYPQPS